MTSYSISQHRCARCYDSKKTLPKKPRDWNICDRVSVVFIIASHKKIMWLLVNSRKKAICNLWPYINWLFRDRAVRFALPGIIGNFFKHSQIFCQWWLSVLYILETLRSVPVRFRKKNTKCWSDFRIGCRLIFGSVCRSPSYLCLSSGRLWVQFDYFEIPPMMTNSFRVSSYYLRKRFRNTLSTLAIPLCKRIKETLHSRF